MLHSQNINLDTSELFSYSFLGVFPTKACKNGFIGFVLSASPAARRKKSGAAERIFVELSSASFAKMFRHNANLVKIG
jgi:hypothetical protein